jgi:hypothetical protein
MQITRTALQSLKLNVNEPTVFNPAKGIHMAEEGNHAP